MNATARRLLRGGNAARSMLVASGLLGALTAIAIVAQAALMAYVVSEAFIGGAELAELSMPLILLAAVALLRALLAGGFELTGRLGAQRVMARLRGRLVRHILVERPNSGQGERSGELAAAAVQGVDSLETYFAKYLPQVILTALVPPTILIVAAFNNWPSAIVLLITAPLIPVFMILIGRSAEDATRLRWQALSLMSAHFLDVVRGLPTLRAHGRADAQQETIERVGDRFKEETMGTLRIAFTSALVLELLAMIGTGLVAAVVGVQLAEGALGFQAGLTVLLLAPELYQPFRQVGAQYHAAADGVAAAERIYAVLDQPPTISAPTRPLPTPSPASGEMRFEGVDFAYPGHENAVLRDVSFSLAPGRSLALLGESGAGKSTIAALALRLLDPSEGRVICGGVDLRDFDPQKWHAITAWVPQRPHIFASSLRENILLGCRKNSKKALDVALAVVGLEELVAALPNGLETRVGDGGRELSLGERQRVGLARAWMRSSPLIVLDEPTAYLDPAAVHRIQRAITSLAQGRTLLLITHDTSTAELADDVLLVRDGRVGAIAGNDRASRPASGRCLVRDISDRLEDQSASEAT